MEVVLYLAIALLRQMGCTSDGAGGGRRAGAGPAPGHPALSCLAFLFMDGRPCYCSPWCVPCPPILAYACACAGGAGLGKGLGCTLDDAGIRRQGEQTPVGVACEHQVGEWVGMDTPGRDMSTPRCNSAVLRWEGLLKNEEDSVSCVDQILYPRQP